MIQAGTTGLNVPNTIVVKYGGSGHLVKSARRSEFSWLWYRSLRIESARLSEVAAALQATAAKSSVVFVVGGIGGFLYTRLARELGLSEKYQQDTGCRIVELLQDMLFELCSVSGTDPAVGRASIAELPAALSRYRLIFLRCSPKLTSTDTLVARAAEVVPGSLLFFFKQTVPQYYFLGRTPVKRERLFLSELWSVSGSMRPLPGENFFLERDALRVLARARPQTYFFNIKAFPELPELISTPRVAPHTVLDYDIEFKEGE